MKKYILLFCFLYIASAILAQVPTHMFQNKDAFDKIPSIKKVEKNHFHIKRCNR